MSAEVQLVVLIRTQTGKGAEQVAAFKRLAPLVHAEAGCLQYELHGVDGDADRFVLFELWASAEALAAHAASAHMAVAAAESASFRAGPVEILRIGARV